MTCKSCKCAFCLEFHKDKTLETISNLTKNSYIFRQWKTSGEITRQLYIGLNTRDYNIKNRLVAACLRKMDFVSARRTGGFIKYKYWG